MPDGGLVHAVTAIMTALAAVVPGAGRQGGRARVVLVVAVPGEGFDSPGRSSARPGS